ncbi:4608_t:CDS:10, partial [Ambispora gerdemannii]
MLANSEKFMLRNDRERKVKSMQVSPVPSSPQPRARPLTMYLSSQDQLFSTTEANNSSVSLAVTADGDGSSVNSFRTMETYDQESVTSDTAVDSTIEPEGVIKYMCDIDGGLNLILERVRQDAQSCKEAALFLKKRAAIEEEYGRMMIKLSKGMQESHQHNVNKQGTYGDSWMNMMRLHEAIGENRVKFAAAISDISEELTSHFKDTEKSRKNSKDAGLKYEKNIQEAEQVLEKAKLKYESQSEEWERKILEKSGDIVPVSKRTLTKSIFNNKPKSPIQLVKMEEEASKKAALANENYKSQLSYTNATRHDYYNVHLPRMITALKDTADECDAALRYHLARYSYLFENTMVSDALVISPVNSEDAPSLRKIVEKIDNEADFQSYVVGFGAKARKVTRKNITYKEYTLSPQVLDIMNPRSIFGVDLAEQMERDGHELPLILVKCAEAIEQYGLESQGIYRLNGATSQIQKLKTLFDRNAEAVDLKTEDFLSDINNIAGVLKLWFRELPEPLFPYNMYYEFINAA